MSLGVMDFLFHPPMMLGLSRCSHECAICLRVPSRQIATDSHLDARKSELIRAQSIILEMKEIL